MAVSSTLIIRVCDSDSKIDLVEIRNPYRMCI